MSLTHPARFAVLLALLLLVWPAPAAAHLDLERSEPADGATLDIPPEVVRLWFSDELDTFESTVGVFDSAGRQVDLGDAQVSLEDRTLMQVSLPAELPPGTYTVRWTAADDADGHPVDGELTFTVVGTSAPTVNRSVGGRSTTVILIVAAVFVIFAGTWLLRRQPSNT